MGLSAHLSKTLCLTLVLFLLAPMPVLAALSSQQRAKLDELEKTLFGSTRVHLSEESRLRAIETNVFGAHKSGSADSRLSAIGKVVHANTSLLLPPLAPQLDRSAILPPASAPPDKPAIQDSTRYDRDPDQVKDILRQAIALHSSGKTLEAERLFKKALSLDPHNADAHFSLGAIAESRGDLNAARDQYRLAQRANPSDSEIAEAVAAVETKLKGQQLAQHKAREQAAAQAKAQAAREQQKRMADQAAAAYRAGNYDAAIKSLEHLSSMAPNDADVLFGLAQSWRGKGDTERARALLHRAISLDPQNQLYQRSLQDLDQQTPAAQGRIASSPDEANAPTGDIVPIAPEPRTAKVQYGFADMNSGDTSYGYSGGDFFRGSGTTPGTRLKRAVGGSLAGAALGALVSGVTRGDVKRGALQGAIYGGLGGLLFGGY